MRRALTWLMWSPGRFYGVAGATVAVAVLVALVTLLSGVHGLSSSRQPAPSPSSSTPKTSNPAATHPVSPVSGSRDAVTAALQLIPEHPTGKAFVESGDTSEAVVRVPVAAGSLDVTVEHDETGWTAVSYQTAR